MPPNVHQIEPEARLASFENHFWALDKSGMDNLFGYLKSALANLDKIHTVYTKRAEIEQEYGQKLQELSTFIQPKEEDYSGTANIYNAMSSELECVSNSHLELSRKMETQIAVSLKQKMDHFKDVLEKWCIALEELYDERQQSTLKLLKLQSKYMKERDSTRGKSSPTYEALLNQYKTYEEEVNKLSQEWNEEWKSACKTMDTMEYRRFDILKDTLSEYADLTSEIMYIQDKTKWSEFIRGELEKYNVEEEIQNCISNYGTGSNVPTAKDYVVDVYQRRKQKKIQKQALNEVQKGSRRERHIQEEPNVQEKYRQRDSIDSVQEQPKRPSSAASMYSDRSSLEQRAPPPLPPVEKSGEPVETEKANRIRKIISENTGSTAQRGQIKRKPLSKSFMEHASNQRVGTRQPEKKDPPASVGSAQKNERKNFDLNDSLELMLRNFESSNGIGPEPEQTEPSLLNQQPAYEHKPDTGSISNRRGNTNHQIPKNREKANQDPPSPPSKKSNSSAQKTHVLKEIERPGSVLNSVSKGDNYLRKSQDLDQNSNYGSQNDRFTNGRAPIVPPKSPRPSPRPSAQVLPEKSQSTSTTYSQNQASQRQSHDPKQQFLLQQQHQQDPQKFAQSPQPPSSPFNQHQPSPMMQNQYASHTHSQQQRQQSVSYTGQPPMQLQQQNNLVPQNQYSYPRQASQSPMMHPQRSPSMQPQPSPGMYPQRSPMMQPQPSPQPHHSLQLTPVMQPTSVPQYGTHRGPPPSPISIPNSNYFNSPLPSPSAPISPGGMLPPSYSYEVPRPTYYGDGTPILFWATSHHTHLSQADGGLSFYANALVAVFKEEGEWWTGATWDPQTNTWSAVGLAPNSKMYKI